MKGHLPTYDGCIICGTREVNPAAMGVRFFWDEDHIDTTFRPDDLYNGYKGIVHGGLITALLDEAMGWAVAVERQAYFVTGEISVRFLKPVYSNQTLRVVARVVSHHARYSVSEGQLLNANGEVLARGTGKFFEISLPEARQIKQYLHFRPGDLDVLKGKL
jgi:uncharacterized protein (TIGR00369 family)